MLGMIVQPLLKVNVYNFLNGPKKCVSKINAIFAFAQQW